MAREEDINIRADLETWAHDQQLIPCSKGRTIRNATHVKGQLSRRRGSTATPSGIVDQQGSDYFTTFLLEGKKMTLEKLFHILSGFTLALLIGPIGGCTVMVPTGSDSSDDDGGRGGVDGEIVLHLPLAAGDSARCTQGAGGTYSHTGTATRHDIDLDTDNDSDEEVYAPIGGTVYVHTDSPSTNFGNHVNIDIGDGKYVIIGHFEEIFVSNESEVAAGQLIGYEGCTGSCSGDHIHLGLHEGDASEDGMNGTSISVSYVTTDMNEGNPAEQTISGDDFVCGIVSEGDPYDGHIYKSSLSVTLWHPGGTLVKVPEDPKVYVLDGEERMWFEDESVFWSYNYDFSALTLISSEERDCYGSSSDLTQDTWIDAIEDAWGTIWLLVGTDDDEDAYKIEVQDTAWQQVLSSWGLDYTEGTLPLDGGLSESMLSHDTLSGYAKLRDGTIVTEQSTSDVYIISEGVALPVKDWDTYLMLGFYDREILIVDDGVVEQVQGEVGDCNAGVWCLDQVAITSCGGGLDLGTGGDAGGEESEDDTEEEEEDEEVEEEEQEDEEEDEEQGEDPLAAEDCGGEDACIADLDGDGQPETLLMIQDQWLSGSLDALPAFVYGNGGCFDGTLAMDDLVYAQNGYYEIDFSEFAQDCSVELTLISSIGTDGNSPEGDMSNWNWWQNASFCSAGSSLCELMDNGVAWEEWLLYVEWDPSIGLMPSGNGYTQNDQL